MRVALDCCLHLMRWLCVSDYLELAFVSRKWNNVVHLYFRRGDTLVFENRATWWDSLRKCLLWRLVTQCQNNVIVFRVDKSCCFAREADLHLLELILSRNVTSLQELELPRFAVMHSQFIGLCRNLRSLEFEYMDRDSDSAKLYSLLVHCRQLRKLHNFESGDLFINNNKDDKNGNNAKVVGRGGGDTKKNCIKSNTEISSLHHSLLSSFEDLNFASTDVKQLATLPPMQLVSLNLLIRHHNRNGYRDTRYVAQHLRAWTHLPPMHTALTSLIVDTELAHIFRKCGQKWYLPNLRQLHLACLPDVIVAAPKVEAAHLAVTLHWSASQWIHVWKRYPLLRKLKLSVRYFDRTPKDAYLPYNWQWSCVPTLARQQRNLVYTCSIPTHLESLRFTDYFPLCMLPIVCRLSRLKSLTILHLFYEQRPLMRHVLQCLSQSLTHVDFGCVSIWSGENTYRPQIRLDYFNLPPSILDSDDLCAPFIHAPQLRHVRSMQWLRILCNVSVPALQTLEFSEHDCQSILSSNCGGVLDLVCRVPHLIMHITEGTAASDVWSNRTLAATKIELAFEGKAPLIHTSRPNRVIPVLYSILQAAVNVRELHLNHFRLTPGEFLDCIAVSSCDYTGAGSDATDDDGVTLANLSCRRTLRTLIIGHCFDLSKSEDAAQTVRLLEFFPNLTEMYLSPRLRQTKDFMACIENYLRRHDRLVYFNCSPLLHSCINY